VSVRGYAEWRASPDALAWVDRTNEVLAAYRSYWPLSVRQIFYRLVAEHSFPKSEKGYGKLTMILSRARRAGLVPWEAIRDGGLGRTVKASYFEDATHFERSIREAAAALRLDRQDGQDVALELWCEAGGMVPILQGIARPYSCRVNTGGGYDSVTAKHRLAERVRSFAQDGRRTVILHVGDFDGSGEDMANVLREDALYMVAAQVLEHVDGPDWIRAERASSEPWSLEASRWACDFFEVRRIALTAEQVVERGVETAPPKPSDSRSAAFVERNAWVADALGTTQITAQLEALTPPELEELITSAIEAELDLDVYERVLEEEERVRAEMVARLER
jgi:hypothetical protein